MKSIKLLLNQKWVKDFFSQKVPRYFPGNQLIDCRIKPLKVYLDYKSVVVKYNLEVSDEKNNISEKEVIGKAERINDRFLKSKKENGILVDYSITNFLYERGLSNILAKPFDYIPSLNLYINEFITGYFLQELSMKHKDREFLEKIPAIVDSLKKVHKIKVQKKDRIIVKNKKQEEKEWQKGLKLVRQYYPSAIDEVTLWVKKCRTLRNRNKKYFNVDSYKMTHGDFYSRNILINDGRIKLIDFSSSSLHDPLNDVGNFLINTELMFEYDFHDSYRQLMENLKDIFLKNYFSKPATEEQEFKINYFILTNLIRIIAFAAMSEGNKKIPSQSIVVMDKLMKIGEEKYNNL